MQTRGLVKWALWSGCFSAVVCVADYSAWTFRTPVVFPGYTNEVVLEDFPVLLSFSEGEGGFLYDRFAHGDGRDLRFATWDDVPVELAYEVEHWDTNGVSMVWLRVPVLSNGLSVAMYKGNVDAGRPAYTTNGAVWGDGHVGVWHLSQGLLDATTNALHGAAYTASPSIELPSPMDGMVAGGMLFSSNAVALPRNDPVWTPQDDLTLSAWVRFDRPPGAVEMLMDWNWASSGNATLRQGYAVLRHSDGRIEFNTYTEEGVGHVQRTASIPDTGVWHYVTATRSGTNKWLFVNESSTRASISAAPMDMDSGYNDQRVSLGVRLQSNLAENRRWFVGALDEVRSESVARSIDWHRASWMNQADPARYVQFQPTVFNHPQAPLFGDPAMLSVTHTSAVFQIALQTDIGGDVQLLWGTVPGGLEPDAWSQRIVVGDRSEGSLEEALLDLNPNTEYAMAFYASNAFGYVVSQPLTFRTLQAPADERFRYRMRIDVSGYDRSEVLANFPVLVALHEGLDGFRYRDFRSVTGADLRFTLPDGQTLLPHEIDHWDPEGVSLVWVGLPALASDSWFYAYWGGGREALEPEPLAPAASVWSDGFAGVWHLNDPLSDSTLFGRDAANGYGPLNSGYYEGVTGMTGPAPGVIGSGRRFSGAALQFPRNDPRWTPADDFTLSAWVRFSAPSSAIETVLDWAWASSGGAANRQGYTIRRQASGALAAIVTTQGGVEHTLNGPAITDTNWHWVAVVREGTNLLLQVDDEMVTRSIEPDPVEFASGYNDFRVSAGARLQSNLVESRWYFNGDLDEIRSASLARSTNWLHAERMNQGWPQTWLTAAPAEYSDPARPVVYAAVGERGGGQAEIVVDLVSTGGSATALMVFWGTANGEDDPDLWDGSSMPVVWSEGVYTQVVSGLNFGASYYTAVRAVNEQGDTWTMPLRFFMPGPPQVVVTESHPEENAVRVRGELAGGYPGAEVFLVWGETDAGPQWSGWSHSLSLGVRPAPALLEHVITDLAPNEWVHFRFAGTNAHGTGWSGPASARAVAWSTPAGTVVFLGNSLTFTYDMPLLSKVFFQAADTPLEVRSRAVGSWWLSDHYSNLNASILVDADYVFLQEQSQIPLSTHHVQNYMYPFSRLLDAEIRTNSARTVFFQTWSNNSVEPESSAIRQTYLTIAQELGAANAPVGLAFKYGDIANNPLGYDLEGNPHQYAAGAYLGVCVFYGTLTGRSPVGNPYVMQALTATQRSFLQQIAEQAVFEDPFGPDGFYWAQDWTSHSNQTPTSLDGRVITGYGTYPSPWVRVSSDVGEIHRVYIGSADPRFGLPGEGRLFITPGGRLRVTDLLQVGRDGTGYLVIDGGELEVDTLMLGGSHPDGGASLVQHGGVMRVARVRAESGSHEALLAGGELIVGEWGSALEPVPLKHTGGRLLPDGSGPTPFYGAWQPETGATLVVRGEGWAFEDDVALQGGLVFDPIGEWDPVPGQELTALTAGVVSGTFAWFEAPDPVNGWAWIPVYMGDRVELHTVSDTLDSDGDGIPDWWEARYGGYATAMDRDGDPDGDGFSNWQEFIARTDPLNPANGALKMMSPMHQNDQGFVLYWPSREGQTFDVESTVSLLVPFAPIVTNLPATPPVNSYINPATDEEENRFFKIRAAW